MNENVFDMDFGELDARAAATPKYTRKQLEKLLEEAIEIHKRGRAKEAMEHYQEILRHDPQNYKAVYFAAIALSQQNQNEERVLELMRFAVEKQPNVPEAHYNLGILLHRLGKEEEAQASFHKAIQLMPGLTEAKTSLGGAYLNLGDPSEGFRWLKAAATTITQKPDSVYSRAFARLTLGDLVGGWGDYDKRWQTASFLVENRRDFGRARHWNGRPIPGKSLYVHTEQGAGDVLMFSRFLPVVAERSQAKYVILEVGDTLVEHLRQLRGVTHVIASNTPVPAEVGPINYYLPMMGMMRQVGFFNYDKVPMPGGWLTVEQGGVTVPPADFRVGISWAGSKMHKNDRYRTIEWTQFRDGLLAAFVGRTDVQFYSFQVGERARDLDAPGPALPLVDLTPQIKTFRDTADAAAQMDLMICVDTATIHAAASLINGPPIWVFIPAAPDWRWLLTGETTPWYSRMTLFRQRHSNDWASVLAGARFALEEVLRRRVVSLGDKVLG